VISDKESLEENISTLLTDSELRINLGKNAKLALTENTDALDNHLRGIQRCLN
jgi:3-deoxy-D-manno-octulosonic-acid transferase